MSASANQQDRKRKWDPEEIPAAAAAAAAAAQGSTRHPASTRNQASILDSLPPDILKGIMNFCAPQDCLQLRAMCQSMKPAADQSLYHRALAKLQTHTKPIQVHRFFLRDDYGYSSLVPDNGFFPHQDEFIEMCMKKIEGGSSELARAREELATKGVSMNYCDAEECYGRCRRCQGKFGRPKTSWYRKLDTATDLEGIKTIMVTWMKVYHQFQEWHDSYLDCCSHVPEEKRVTFDEFDDIRDIMFGLYAGSSQTSECAFTTLEFRDFGRGFNSNKTKHFALFPGPKGQKMVFEFGFSGFSEYWD